MTWKKYLCNKDERILSSESKIHKNLVLYKELKVTERLDDVGLSDIRHYLITCVFARIRQWQEGLNVSGLFFINGGMTLIPIQYKVSLNRGIVQMCLYVELKILHYIFILLIPDHILAPGLNY